MAKQILLFCVLTIPLIGCANRQTLECSQEYPNPNTLDMRDDHLFDLALDSESGVLVFGDEIPLVIKNISKNEIWFPSDLNVFILNRFSETNIQVVQNFTLNPTGQDVILGVKASTNDEFRFSVKPELIDLGKMANLEIMISGYVHQDGKYCEGLYSDFINLDIYPPNQ